MRGSIAAVAAGGRIQGAVQCNQPGTTIMRSRTSGRRVGDCPA